MPCGPAMKPDGSHNIRGVPDCLPARVPGPQGPTFLTPAEFARVLHVCEETVLRELRRRRCGYSRIGRVYRISREDALRYLWDVHVESNRPRALGVSVPVRLEQGQFEELWGRIRRLFEQEQTERTEEAA